MFPAFHTVAYNYRVPDSPNDSVTRIVEGFAPGHLIALSKEDDYFSPHSTATAIDMQLDSNEREKLLTFGKAKLEIRNERCSL